MREHARDAGLSRRALGTSQELGPHQERGHQRVREDSSQRNTWQADSAWHRHSSSAGWETSVRVLQPVQVFSIVDRSRCQARSEINPFDRRAFDHVTHALSQLYIDRVLVDLHLVDGHSIRQWPAEKLASAHIVPGEVPRAYDDMAFELPPGERSPVMPARISEGVEGPCHVDQKQPFPVGDHHLHLAWG